MPNYMKPRPWHYWITLLLALALVPALLRLHLPLRFDWITVSVAYWLILAAQSIFVAAILSLIGLPRKTVLDPLTERYRRNPLRIVFLLIYFGILLWAFTWPKALILTVDTAAVIELIQALTVQERRRLAAAVLVPALYLFAGFLLVLTYNTIVVSVRYNFAYDAAFNSMDRWLLFGHTVSGISHWALTKFPLCFFHFLEFIYFGMFPQIGATIILIALSGRKKQSLQFVGTILTAYYLSLALFTAWPSQGPSYLCRDHFSRYPSSLQAYTIQNVIIAHATALWNHVPMRRISTDYFIAFPCMHITQPIIVMWFLRRWKRMLIVLGLYDILLTASIVLLEWHYVVDIVGGVLVAVLAIVITDSSALRTLWNRKEVKAAPEAVSSAG